MVGIFHTGVAIDHGSVKPHQAVIEGAIHIHVIADHRLWVHIVGGLLPEQPRLAVFEGHPVIGQVSGRGGWDGVIRIARFRGHCDGMTQRRVVPAEIAGLRGEGVIRLGRERAQCRRRISRTLHDRVAIHKDRKLYIGAVLDGGPGQ